MFQLVRLASHAFAVCYHHACTLKEACGRGEPIVVYVEVGLGEAPYY
jgi:hypothetical protein